MITGFPSPAQGYEEKKIDLNEQLISHPAATFFMRIATDRYNRMGIYNEDLLIVDRAKKLNEKSLVVYESEGNFVMGRVQDIHETTLITGAVVYVIHKVREK